MSTKKDKPRVKKIVYSDEAALHLVCAECFKVCKSRKGLRKHIKICQPEHVKKRRKFSKGNALKAGQLNTHKLNLNKEVIVEQNVIHITPATCPGCFEVFSSRKKLREHKKKSHCDLSTNETVKVLNENHFNLHKAEQEEPKGEIKTEIDQKHFVCSECFEIFTSYKKLRKHRRAEHSAEVSVNLTEAATPKEIHLIDERRTEDYQHSRSVCPCCFEVFDNNTKLRKHKRKAHRVDDSLDPNVLKESKSKKIKLRDEVKSEIISKAEFNSNPAVCPECFEVFDTQKKLRKHIRKVHLTIKTKSKRLKLESRKSEDDQITIETELKAEDTSTILNDTKEHNEKGQWKSSKQRESKFECSFCPCKFTNNWKKNRHEESHKRLNLSLRSICPTCNEEFIDFDSLLVHVTIAHSKATSVKECRICFKTFESPSKRVRHEEIHKARDERPQLTCENCNIVFLAQQNLDLHQTKCHGANDQGNKCEDMKPKLKTSAVKKTSNYKCSICSKIFKDNWFKNRHEESHKLESERTKFLCDNCDSEFFSKGHLASHLRDRVNCDNVIKRDIRNRVRKQRLLERKPKRKGREKSRYECRVCFKAFKDNWYLSRHEEIHKLDIERKRRSRKRALVKNQESDGIVEKETYDDFYKRTRLSEKLLTPEITMYVDEMPEIKIEPPVEVESFDDPPLDFKLSYFKCFDCNLSFLDFMTLALHSHIIHGGSKSSQETKESKGNHKCDFCPKTFPFKSAKRQHEAMHTSKEERRKFSCGKCNLVLTHKRYLQRHSAKCDGTIKFKNGRILTTDGRRKFQCENCNLVYMRKDTLNLHKLKCGGDDRRKFTCEKCDFAFIHEKRLISHRENCKGKIKSRNEVLQALKINEMEIEKCKERNEILKRTEEFVEQVKNERSILGEFPHLFFLT